MLRYGNIAWWNRIDIPDGSVTKVFTSVDEDPEHHGVRSILRTTEKDPQFDRLGTHYIREDWFLNFNLLMGRGYGPWILASLENNNGSNNATLVAGVLVPLHFSTSAVSRQRAVEWKFKVPTFGEYENYFHPASENLDRYNGSVVESYNEIEGGVDTLLTLNTSPFFTGRRFPVITTADWVTVQHHAEEAIVDMVFAHVRAVDVEPREVVDVAEDDVLLIDEMDEVDQPEPEPETEPVDLRDDDDEQKQFDVPQITQPPPPPPPPPLPPPPSQRSLPDAPGPIPVRPSVRTSMQNLSLLRPVGNEVSVQAYLLPPIVVQDVEDFVALVEGVSHNVEQFFHGDGNPEFLRLFMDRDDVKQVSKIRRTSVREPIYVKLPSIRGSTKVWEAIELHWESMNMSYLLFPYDKKLIQALVAMHIISWLMNASRQPITIGFDPTLVRMPSINFDQDPRHGIYTQWPLGVRINAQGLVSQVYTPWTTIRDSMALYSERASQEQHTWLIFVVAGPAANADRVDEKKHILGNVEPFTENEDEFRMSNVPHLAFSARSYSTYKVTEPGTLCQSPTEFVRVIRNAMLPPYNETGTDPDEIRLQLLLHAVSEMYHDEAVQHRVEDYPIEGVDAWFNELNELHASLAHTGNTTSEMLNFWDKQIGAVHLEVLEATIFPGSSASARRRWRPRSACADDNNTMVRRGPAAIHEARDQHDRVYHILQLARIVRLLDMGKLDDYLAQHPDIVPLLDVSDLAVCNLFRNDEPLKQQLDENRALAELFADAMDVDTDLHDRSICDNLGAIEHRAAHFDRHHDTVLSAPPVTEPRPTWSVYSQLHNNRTDDWERFRQQQHQWDKAQHLRDRAQLVLKQRRLLLLAKFVERLDRERGATSTTPLTTWLDTDTALIDLLGQQSHLKPDAIDELFVDVPEHHRSVDRPLLKFPPNTSLDNAFDQILEAHEGFLTDEQERRSAYAGRSYDTSGHEGDIDDDHWFLLDDPKRHANILQQRAQREAKRNRFRRIDDLSLVVNRIDAHTDTDHSLQTILRHAPLRNVWVHHPDDVALDIVVVVHSAEADADADADRYGYATDFSGSDGGEYTGNESDVTSTGDDTDTDDDSRVGEFQQRLRDRSANTEHTMIVPVDNLYDRSTRCQLRLPGGGLDTRLCRIIDVEPNAPDGLVYHVEYESDVVDDNGDPVQPGWVTPSQLVLLDKDENGEYQVRPPDEPIPADGDTDPEDEDEEDTEEEGDTEEEEEEEDDEDDQDRGGHPDSDNERQTSTDDDDDLSDISSVN